MVAMRDTLDARVTLEVAIVRLTNPEADDEPGALLERIERLERRVQDLAGSVSAATHTLTVTPPVPAPPPPPPGPARAAPTGPSQVLGALSASPVGEPTGQSRAEIEARPALGAFAAASTATAAPAQPTPEPSPTVSDRPVVEAEPEGGLAPPTRDELVEAWGDHVLNQLRPRVRAVFAVGRFLASDGSTAVLALPNGAHVERASVDCDEVADAIASHFGRPVRLRLVSEADAGTTYPSPPSPGGGPRPADVVAEDHLAAPTGTAAAKGALDLAGGEEMLDPDDLDPAAEQVPGTRSPGPRSA